MAGSNEPVTRLPGESKVQMQNQSALPVYQTGLTKALRFTNRNPNEPNLTGCSNEYGDVDGSVTYCRG